MAEIWSRAVWPEHVPKARERCPRSLPLFIPFIGYFLSPLHPPTNGVGWADARYNYLSSWKTQYS